MGSLPLFSSPGLYLLPHPNPTPPQDIFIIYAEVKCPQLGEVQAKGLNIRSRTLNPLSDYEVVLC